MSDSTEFGADRDIEHMLSCIRHEWYQLVAARSEDELWGMWRLLQFALREAGRGGRP